MSISRDITAIKNFETEQELLRNEYGLVFVVRAMEIDFLKPARLDDALSVTAAVQDCRKASMVFAQSIRRGDELLLTAQVRIAALHADSFRPRGIPQPLLAQLQAHSLQDPEVPPAA